jgi:hypothetical protein
VEETDSAVGMEVVSVKVTGRLALVVDAPVVGFFLERTF